MKDFRGIYGDASLSDGVMKQPIAAVLGATDENLG